MTVGNQTTVTQVNSNLSSYALQMRQLMRQILDQWQYLNQLGQTGLENLGGTGNGFSSADAAQVLTYIDYMQTVAGVYMGTVQAQGSGGTAAILYDFDSALTPLWAGQ